MNVHVSTWLEAYHDGELKGRQLRHAEEHLTRCMICQKELVKIEGISSLLQSIPGPEGLSQTDQFVAQVGLQLPRHPEQPLWQKLIFGGWKVAPFGLFGLWAFLQAVFVVVAVVSLAANLGLGGDLLSGLVPSPSVQPGVETFISHEGTSLERILRTAWYYLSVGGPLGWSSMVNVGLFVAIGLLYWSWLASWWIRQQHEETPDGELAKHVDALANL